MWEICRKRLVRQEKILVKFPLENAGDLLYNFYTEYRKRCIKETTMRYSKLYYTTFKIFKKLTKRSRK